MRQYIHRLQSKFIIFSPLGLFLQLVAKLGCKIYPYYVYSNLAGRVNSPSLPGADAAYDFVELADDELSAICDLPCRPRDRAYVLKLYQEGSRCFALKKLTAVCSYVWADYNYFMIKGKRVGKLAHTEAFFFDSYTVESSRGQGLSPYLFLKAYAYCRGLGKEKFYIFCSIFNKSARNVYAKLNPVTEGLAWHIDLWGIHTRNILPRSLGQRKVPA